MPAPTYFNTPARIIRGAMENAGLIGDNVEPTSDQYARHSNKLNDLISLWMVKDGLKLWTWVDQPVTLVAGTGTYAAMSGGAIDLARPYDVEEVYYVPSSGGQRPVGQMSWTDWLAVSQDTQQGSVTRVFIEKLADRLNVHCRQVPDTAAAAGVLHVVFSTQIVNFTGLVDTMSFSTPWFLALQWGLAAEICTGQPQPIVERCEMKAQYYYNILSDSDVENVPTQFEVDSRVGVPGSFA